MAPSPPIDLDLLFTRGVFRLEMSCRIDSRVTAIFGRSGAGKSTLLHLLAGLFAPERGRIAVGGETLIDTDRGVRLPPHRRGIGMVFQDGRLLPHYSVRGNLTYGRRRSNGRSGLIELDAVVELLELEPLLSRRTHQLSGGELQRVAIGRALLSGPRLLLLDEPLTGLDEPLKRQVLPFLQRVRDELNVPILYVSHHLDELLQVTDQMLILDSGRLAGQGRLVDLAMEDGTTSLLLDGGLTNVLKLEPADGGGLAIATSAGTGQALVIRGATDGCAAATVAIRPEDIALAASTVAATSIRNQLRSHVVRCSRHRDGVLVEVNVGQSLLVQITSEAASELAVRPGLEIWCLIKSTAIRRLS